MSIRGNGRRQGGGYRSQGTRESNPFEERNMNGNYRFDEPQNALNPNEWPRLQRKIRQ